MYIKLNNIWAYNKLKNSFGELTAVKLKPLVYFNRLLSTKICDVMFMYHHK